MKHTRPPSDIEIIGKRTSFIAVVRSVTEKRDWLRGMPDCPLLAAHNIGHTGVMQAYHPYEILRVNQSGTFMMACLDGEGVVMVDGLWKTIRAGQACLLPPFVMNSLKCTKGKPWRFAWVRYEESKSAKPIVSSVSPVIGAFAGGGLENAINGLFNESSGGKNPSALHQWTTLVHHYVLRFAEPTHLDGRLWKLWNIVEKDPSRDWTLHSLAEKSFLSTEHLRRLCHREIGRSPMRHLTFIRLQLAMDMLSGTGDKIDTIARSVGFSGIHAFSNAFRTRYGRPPSDFR